jgi:hypothetical protein
VIESRPEQEDTWRERIQAVHGENFPLLICRPLPEPVL